MVSVEDVQLSISHSLYACHAAMHATGTGSVDAGPVYANRTLVARYSVLRKRDGSDEGTDKERRKQSPGRHVVSSRPDPPGRRHYRRADRKRKSCRSGWTTAGRPDHIGRRNRSAVTSRSLFPGALAESARRSSRSRLASRRPDSDGRPDTRRDPGRTLCPSGRSAGDRDGRRGDDLVPTRPLPDLPHRAVGLRYVDGIPQPAQRRRLSLRLALPRYGSPRRQPFIP